MRTLIHNSPAGALQIAGLLNPVEPNEPFDVDDALAESLLHSDLYTEVVTAKPISELSPKELRAIATERGLEVPSRATKKQLLELVESVEWPVLEDGVTLTDPIAGAAIAEPATAAEEQGDPQ
ncbi:hypothetical protein ACFVTX_18195 [Agromyces sp. NPDC058136]|uniref:hypothetical protein n=1 Tax=Agromyces sp. NPDC058136 TaxID=3346354 RepID=UPI0036D9F552